MARYQRVVAGAVEHQSVHHIMAVARSDTEAGELRTIGEGADADARHRRGNDDIVDSGTAVEGKGAYAFKPVGERNRCNVLAETESHISEVAHIRRHSGHSSGSIRHHAEREAVFALEASVNGTIIWIIAIDGDAAQAPRPESATAILLEMCRKMQRRDAGIEKSVVAKGAQRVGQLQRGEAGVVEAIRPDAANGRRESHAGDIAATLKSRFAHGGNSIGDSVVIHRLRNGDSSAIRAAQHDVIGLHLYGLLRCDAIYYAVGNKTLAHGTNTQKQ